MLMKFILFETYIKIYFQFINVAINLKVVVYYCVFCKLFRICLP